jgi:hypothetical protein
LTEQQLLGFFMPLRRPGLTKPWLGFSRGGAAKASCGWVLAVAALHRQAEAGF